MFELTVSYRKRDQLVFEREERGRDKGEDKEKWRSSRGKERLTEIEIEGGI